MVRTWQLIVREIVYRKLNFLLGLVAVAATVTLFVFYLTTSEASRRETRRITRDMGFNLRIIPKDTDMERFWMQGYSDRTMPESVLTRFVSYKDVFLSYNHLTATLQQRFELRGLPVLLTGVAPAITAPAQRNRPMGFRIQPGKLYVGFQVAQKLGLKRGEELELNGRKFQVARILAETGSREDMCVYGLLKDIQEVLNLPGQINEIRAIDCLCLTPDEDPLGKLRAELAKALPEAQVIQLRAIAEARARQRRMVDEYFGLATPLMVGVCAAWVGLLAVMNVRERRQEIGILRALGHGSGRIAGLFLGRAVLTGGLGALIGFALGSALALIYGPDIFQITASAIRLESRLLGWAMLLAPALAALASCIPTVAAVTQDPAVALREP